VAFWGLGDQKYIQKYIWVVLLETPEGYVSINGVFEDSVVVIMK